MIFNYNILWVRVRIKVLGPVNSGHNLKPYNPSIIIALILTLIRVDCLKRSQHGLCSKPPDLRSVGDIAVNPSLSKSKRE